MYGVRVSLAFVGLIAGASAACRGASNADHSGLAAYGASNYAATFSLRALDESRSFEVLVTRAGPDAMRIESRTSEGAQGTLMVMDDDVEFVCDDAAKSCMDISGAGGAFNLPSAFVESSLGGRGESDDVDDNVSLDARCYVGFRTSIVQATGERVYLDEERDCLSRHGVPTYSTGMFAAAIGQVARLRIDERGMVLPEGSGRYELVLLHVEEGSQRPDTSAPYEVEVFRGLTSE